jgi:hypothetical protein
LSITDQIPENYSKSLLPGLRAGSPERKPKINNNKKEATTTFTTIFKVNIFLIYSNDLMLNISYRKEESKYFGVASLRDDL